MSCSNNIWIKWEAKSRDSREQNYGSSLSDEIGSEVDVDDADLGPNKVFVVREIGRDIPGRFSKQNFSSWILN